MSELSGSSVSLEISDKLAHLALYSVLGATLAWGRWSSRGAAPHGLVLAAGTAWGALDEWHQSFVPGRDPSATDFAADVVGLGVGYLMGLGALRALHGGLPPSS